MKLPLLTAAIFLSAILYADDAAAPKKMGSYTDFQWQPVVVESANPSGEVRGQFDFTVPIHGQYLTNPGQSSITITWITRVPCGGGIEYREKGTEEFKRVWQKFYAQIDCSSDLHTVHLENLKPGTEYEYRLLSLTDKAFGYAATVTVGREIFTFTTLDRAKERYQVFFTADVHGTFRLTLDPILANSNAKNADLYFLIGDFVEDNMINARYYLFQGLLDDISSKWGKNKPTVFLRGNHELTGREQYHYGKYFPRKDEKTYFSFPHGKVLYVVLDSMWSGSDSKEQTAAYMEYLQEQADWLKELKKSKEWKDAEFRVVAAHIATHGGSGGTAYMSQYFKDILNDKTKDGRIHLFICGHEHSHTRIDPNSTDAKVTRPKAVGELEGDYNYGILICDLIAAVNMDVEPGKLTLTAYKWGTGEKIDSFIITPDGKFTDNMEVKVIPSPGKEQPAK